MFLAMMIVCLTFDANSCDLVYNTKEVFVTQEACEEDLKNTLLSVPTEVLYSIKTGCVVLPGHSA